MWVWSLGWEDPMEKGTAIHFSNLVWRIPWAEEPGGLQFMGSRGVGHDWSDSLCKMCTLKKKMQNWHSDMGWKMQSKKIRLSDQLFPGGPDHKESSYNAGDPGSIPELARYPEGDMATHSRIPGWRTPWTEEPGGLQSTGSHRVRHSWVTFNSLHFRSLSSVLWSTALVSKLPKWFRPPSPVWQLLPSSKKQKKSQRTKNSYEMERL